MKYSLGKSAILAASTLLSAVLASDVLQLTGSTFDDVIAKNDLVMAEFYAPWCGHCQALAPEYEDAATSLKERGIVIAKIDCTQEEALCSEHKIQGFPTLMVFHGADNVANYGGARKAEDIVSYMIRQSLPAVSDVTSKSIDQFSQSNSVVIVGFYSDKSANATFGGLAEKLRDRYTFGASSDAKLAAKYGLTAKDLPAAVVFKNFEDDEESPKFVAYKSTKEDKFDAESIQSFINLESFPVIGEVGPSTFSSYATSNIPLLYLFVDNDEDREELTSVIKPLAAKLKGHANIGFLDANKYGAHAANVNIKESWPAVVIQDFESNLKYVHSQAEEITKKSLVKFVEEFVSGKLAPSIKSEEIPEEQGPVVKVVGKSYDDIVLDDSKDVLIEFYAPWCGHCKNLAPIYEELGTIVSSDSNLSSKVVIAKLDHTENEVPDDIAGYPTLKLFPANGKGKPIVFDGPRTLEALAKFIEEKGTFNADILTLKEKRDAEAPVEEAEEAEEVDDSVKHDDL